MVFKNSLTFIFLSTLVSLILTTTSCSKVQTSIAKSDQFSLALWEKSRTNEASNITVVNQFGEPIQFAKILIGNAAGNPFRGNLLETDKTGSAQAPLDWTAAAHVTVDAEGYVRQTMLNQKPGNITLKMKSIYSAQPVELSGLVTNLPVVNGDKLIDFGLVMPALNRADILNFNLDQVISPYSDVMTVAGQKAELPSNVSLPTQKEIYFVNLTIAKPVYRLFVPSLGPKTFYAARGRFPFKTVIDEIRAGKPFYEVMNYFTLLGGGLRDTTLVAPKTALDIPGTELEFTAKVKTQTAETQPDEILMMLAASEVAGTLIPTDVKKSASNQALTMTSMANKPAYIVSVIKKQSEVASQAAAGDRLSASLMPYTEGEKQKLLPLVANPTIENSAYYTIHLPTAPTTNGINPIAVSACISDLVETIDGTTHIITANHRWDIIGLGWSSDIVLPEWPLAPTSNKKRVEINFIGSTQNQPVNLDDSIIDAATHVSHSSSDF